MLVREFESESGQAAGLVEGWFWGVSDVRADTFFVTLFFFIFAILFTSYKGYGMVRKENLSP
jgi:hypothetical protein